MVYGLSLLTKYRNTGFYKPYLIFSLTDETYALLTTIEEKDWADRNKFYFYVSILDQIYWIAGSTIGALAGSLLSVNTKGIEFALTALFVVLFIEQFRKHKNKIPFIIPALYGIFSLIIAGPGNMLVAAIVSSLIVLILFKRRLQNDES